MERYRFSESEERFIRTSSLPIAVYQFIDGRVVTVALSQGFADQFGFSDIEEAIYYMDNDMYRDSHPDDVARISEAAYRFATEGGEYDTVYRNRSPKDSDYRIIHAKGHHEIKDDGTRLAVIWYTDEGEFREGASEFSSSLNMNLSSALYRESILQESHYDSLTGLPNMTHFFRLSETGRDKLLDAKRQPAMIYFDLNGMKGFNSKYGFSEGNILLKEFAGILVKHFGSNRCGRIGGDHFIAYADDDGLKETLEAIFEECRDMNGGKTLTVRAGIFLKVIGTNLDAGVACDRAKAAADSIKYYHRSAYKYFDDDMLAEIEHKQYIIDSFDQALEENWIKVYYQPIIRAANGRVCDEEALSRWIDPERGIIPPDEFIPILEKARLIYRLDLYVLEEILRKIEKSENEGMYIVPQSVNLSRYDFESCDIVEEIRKRVDDAGISHDKIAIEITESVIGSDFDYMKTQVERLHDLGFKVWMDDFGSDYSSLDLLQSIPFDLMKLDRRFMKQFHEGEKTRIIITELVRMAISLGIETITEGVETEDQVEFLREIGCTKLQGFYFCKPIPHEEIVERYNNGIQIGYENPDESSYYEAIGKISLYDISGMGREEAELREYFDTLPMAIIEYNEPFYDIIRENKSFRKYQKRVSPKPTGTFLEALRKCGEEGNNLVIDEVLDDGTAVHSYLKRVAVNPVSGVSAVALAVLATTAKDQQAPGTTSAAVAKALSADYFDLYYVNIETDDYMQYGFSEETSELNVFRYGNGFFDSGRKDALTFVYKPDRKEFLEAFNKENILRILEETGVFTHTYRILVGSDGKTPDADGDPVYVSMKITGIGNDDKHVIMGVNNIDTEMRHKAELERIMDERKIYSRMTAITGDYIVFYTVDPETGDYAEYNASDLYEEFGISKTGHDFFEQARKNSVNAVYPKDLEMVLNELTKENVLESIEKNGIFSLRYRLMIGGVPRYIFLRAGISEEEDGPKIIVGINDINDAVRGEIEHSQKIDILRKSAPAGDASAEESYQLIADSISKPCAVLSVQKKADGGCGEIRILRANKAYKETMGAAYRDGMLYHELVPKDIKFEDFCYRAAILGQKMHSYVETKALEAWTDLELVPMTSPDEDMGCCLFLFEFTKGPEADRMADVSIETAETAIRSCIRLMGAEDFRQSVHSVLEDIRSIGDGLSCMVLLVDKENEVAVKYSEALRPDSRFSGIELEEVLPYELVKTWEDLLRESNAIIIKDEQDLDYLAIRNPEWAESLRTHKISSLIMLPLYQNREIFGYIHLSSFDTSKVVELKEIMELISFFLGTEISNRLLHERMEMMLRTDVLTGANNRYAMLQRISEIDGRPFGVISLDLNGLKRVNDEQGHDAGDRLLVQASEVLSKVFYQEDIFRTGGDEFVVISADIKKEVFERKLARLRRDADKNVDVSFSMGSYWSDGSVPAHKAFRIADDNMYKDKKEFYVRNPHLRRR